MGNKVTRQENLYTAQQVISPQNGFSMYYTPAYGYPYRTRDGEIYTDNVYDLPVTMQKKGASQPIPVPYDLSGISFPLSQYRQQPYPQFGPPTWQQCARARSVPKPEWLNEGYRNVKRHKR
jgi:hypothetical protein